MIDPTLPLRKIFSGGQTGADWAALDWAIAHDFVHGGWCPRGRIAENGRIDARFQLEETPSEHYPLRTRWNVRDSDGTVIFSLEPELVGGSLLTRELAKQAGKPCLVLTAADDYPAEELRQFIDEHFVEVLNVAGPRLSTQPGIGQFVTSVLDRALLVE